MAKHKTLQQKKLADIRRAHFVYSLENKDFSAASDATKPVIAPSSSQTIVAVSIYSYVKHDIVKTSLLTLSIIGFQTMLFILLQNHILVLPNIIY